MLVRQGAAALSDFRKSKLLKQLKRVSKQIGSVDARYIHFIDTPGKISAKEDDRLAELLSYDSPFNGTDQGELF